MKFLQPIIPAKPVFYYELQPFLGTQPFLFNHWFSAEKILSPNQCNSHCNTHSILLPKPTMSHLDLYKDNAIHLMNLEESSATMMQQDMWCCCSTLTPLKDGRSNLKEVWQVSMKCVKLLSQNVICLRNRNASRS